GWAAEFCSWCKNESRPNQSVAADRTGPALLPRWSQASVVLSCFRPAAELGCSASREGGAVKTTILNILGGFAFVAVIGGILFGSAGRWDLPLFWAYLGVWAAALVAGGIVSDPTLTRERLRPGPGGKDYLSILVVTPIWLGLHVVAGLD